MSLVDKLETNLIDGDNAIWDQYRNHILLGLVVVLVFCGALGYWVIRGSMLETQSRLKFALAKTLDERAAVVQEYLGTQQMAAGLLLVADEFLREGKTEEAEKFYNLFLQTYSRHVLANGARLGLGYTMEARGKQEDAIKLFDEVSAVLPPDTYSAMALLELGRIYVAKGQLDKARQALGEAINKSAPQSYVKSVASERLKEITPTVPKPAAPLPAAGSTNAAPVTPAVPATNAGTVPAAPTSTNAPAAAAPASASAPAPVVPAAAPTNASGTPPPGPAATNASQPAKSAIPTASAK